MFLSNYTDLYPNNVYVDTMGTKKDGEQKKKNVLFITRIINAPGDMTRTSVPPVR